MLGLGTSTVKGGPAKRLVGTYTSDFTGGGGDNSSGWSGSSIQGTLTLATNQTIDGTSGWLKGTFDTEQTDTNILLELDDPGFTISSGMATEISYKIYIVDDSNKWGSSPPITHRFYYASKWVHASVDYDTTTSLSGNNTAGASSAVYINFGPGGDLPLAGAVFYVKDIVYTVHSM